jgi:hypothetical protein
MEWARLFIATRCGKRSGNPLDCFPVAIGWPDLVAAWAGLRWLR